jgi:uncharacterized protein with GYD domain
MPNVRKINQEINMPKYLMQINYTVEGPKGVVKDGGSARLAAAQKLAGSQGGASRVDVLCVRRYRRLRYCRGA